MITRSKPDAEFVEEFNSTRSPMISTDKQSRKERPIARGCLDYFPDALAEVSHVSFVGNKQHNGPDAELHWDRAKSLDHADCILRHLLDRGTLDTDGLRHSAKVAWRALALLQIELEAEQQKTPLEEKVAAGLEAAFGEHLKDQPPSNFTPLFYAMNNSDAREVSPSTWDPFMEEWERQVAVWELQDGVNAGGAILTDPVSKGLAAVDWETVAKQAAAQEDQGFIPIHDFDKAMESEPNFGQAVVDAMLAVQYDDAVKTQADLQAELEDAFLNAIGEDLPRVYVAGPMRGYADFNFPAFDAARDHLIKDNWAVISPADIDRQQDRGVVQPHHVYAKRDTEIIIDLAANNPTGKNSLYVLQDWWKSKGASAEHALATWLELNIMYQE